MFHQFVYWSLWPWPIDFSPLTNWFLCQLVYLFFNLVGFCSLGQLVCLSFNLVGFCSLGQLVFLSFSSVGFCSLGQLVCLSFNLVGFCSLGQLIYLFFTNWSLYPCNNYKVFNIFQVQSSKLSGSPKPDACKIVHEHIKWVVPQARLAYEK
jgi:hypothetical protein